jgi:zinc transport system substrate-binding protein
VKRLFFWFLLTVSLSAKVTVAVSIAAEEYLAKRVGGDLVEVFTLSPKNSSSHQYEPKMADMKLISRADLYLACGVEFERSWLKRFASNAPKMRIVHLDRKIERSAERKFDTHIWFSTENMRLMAEETVRALMIADPANSAIYLQNGSKTINEIDQVKKYIDGKLNGYRGRIFLTDHPAFGFFADEFGLRQLSIEIDHHEPKPRDIQAIIKVAKEKNIKTIFAEKNMAHKIADTIADAIGAKVVELELVSSDWANQMIDIADSFERAFDESN